MTMIRIISILAVAFLIIGSVKAQEDPKVSWTNIEGVALNSDGNDLVKIPVTTQDPSSVGLATSHNKLLANQDGYVSYMVDEGEDTKILALTPDLGEDGLGGLEHAFYLTEGEVYIFENGEMIGAYGSYEQDMELKIEREGDNVFYYKDGRSIHETSVENEKELRVKTILLDVGAVFNNVTTNFDNVPLLKINGVGIENITSYNIVAAIIDLNETYTVGTEESLTFPFRKGENLLLNVGLNGLPVGDNGTVAITIQPDMEVVSSILTITQSNETYSYYTDSYLTPEGVNIDFNFTKLVEQKISLCPEADDLHWVANKQYDRNGIVIGENKTYLDDIGRPIQSQARNFSTNDIMAVQNLYDAFGRTAISSLPAPIYSGSFCYKPNFITANSGQQYDASKFDLPNTTAQSLGEQDNPFALDHTLKGSLGWYYSNQNTEEPYVAASGIPYSRVDYYDDPLGRAKKVAGVSENYQMGSGHETQVIYGAAGFELDYVYGVNFSNNRNVSKTIVVDADGLEQISYTDASDKVLATCYSGLDNNCLNIPIKHDLDYYQGRSVDIHLPDIPGQQLKWYFNTSYSCCDPNYVEIKLVDLISGNELVSGTDYTLTAAKTFVFNGAYANKTLFLRISYDYTDAYIGSGGGYYTGMCGGNSLQPHSGSNIPYQSFGYTLDYSNWSLNYYDERGRLVKNVPPEGVDCNGIDANVNYVTDDDIGLNKPIYDNATSTYLINPGNYTDNIYNYYDYKVDPAGIFNDVTTQTHKVELSFFPSVYEVPYEGCETVLNTYPSPEVEGASGRTINLVLDYLEKNTAYSRSKLFTSETITGETTTSDFSENHYPVLVRDGLLIGNENFRVDANSGGSIAQAIGIGIDPLPPGCEGHCFNGILDTHCGETAIDEGPDCGVTPYHPCDGVPPVLAATYQLEVELTMDDAGTLVYVKPDGTTQATPYSYYVYPKLYKTCECKYYWDNASLTTVNLTIPNSVLNDYQDGIHMSLKSIGVAKNEYATYFDAFDPTDWIHNLAQYIVFQARLKQSVGPLMGDNISHSMETTFGYDNLNRLTTKDSPDEGRTETVYDVQNKIRFTQNAQQEVDKKFAYINYDRAGRPIESGVYDYTSAASLQFQNSEGLPLVGVGQTSVLTVLDDPDGLNDVFCSEQVYSKYDLADDISSPHYPFTIAPYNNYQQTHLLGRVSKTWNEHSIMWYSYDMYGRVLWTIEYFNDPSIATYKTIDYEYDAADNVVKMIYQKYDGEYFEHRNTYDNGQKLVKVETSRNGTIYYDQANYEYYQHGPLKRTEIGNKLQGIDYVYTIEGKLKAINSPNLGTINSSSIFNDPGGDALASNGVKKDIFGMVIDYHQNDYNRLGTNINYGWGTNEKFTGTINQIRWNLDAPALTGTNLVAQDKQNAYQYQYNEFNWLTTATFGAYDPIGFQNADEVIGSDADGFTADAEQQFKVSGITYDKNGNIESLVRNGNTTSGIEMDNLTYQYNTITQAADGDVVKVNNQLTQVLDGIGNSVYPTDIENQASNNYTYNEIGELTDDASESRTYTYYQNGLAKEVFDNGNLKLKFEYNARGQRIKKYIYSSSGAVLSEIFYIRDIVGNVVSTHDRNVPEEITSKDYAIIGLAQIGMFDPSTLESRYLMHDHLGNVRATFRENAGNIQVLSANEFYPFGSTMPGRNVVSGIDKINYGYQGQELDETGLNSFPLRMYDSRLGRWLRTDPYYQHYSPYLAMSNNPVSFIDPTGGEDEDGNEDEDFDWGSPLGQLLIAAMNESGTSAEYENKEAEYDYISYMARLGEPVMNHYVFERKVTEQFVADFTYGSVLVDHTTTISTSVVWLAQVEPTYGSANEDKDDLDKLFEGLEGTSDGVNQFLNDFADGKLFDDKNGVNLEVVLDKVVHSLLDEDYADQTISEVQDYFNGVQDYFNQASPYQIGFGVGYGASSLATSIFIRRGVGIGIGGLSRISIFGANGGYGYTYGRFSGLYRTPRVGGGTLFQYKSSKSLFRLDLDMKNGLHYHKGLGNKGRRHRPILPAYIFFKQQK